MTPADIIARAQDAGVTLAVSAGEITAAGRPSAVASLLPDIRTHKADLLRLLTEVIEVQTDTAVCEMQVPAERVSDFMKEAIRRGLLVCYRLKDESGRPLPGCGIEMPGPGQKAAQLRDRLRAEFGERLAEVTP